MVALGPLTAQLTDLLGLTGGDRFAEAMRIFDHFYSANADSKPA